MGQGQRGFQVAADVNHGHTTNQYKETFVNHSSVMLTSITLAFRHSSLKMAAYFKEEPLNMWLSVCKNLVYCILFQDTCRMTMQNGFEGAEN